MIVYLIIRSLCFLFLLVVCQVSCKIVECYVDWFKNNFAMSVRIRIPPLHPLLKGKTSPQRGVLGKTLNCIQRWDLLKLWGVWHTPSLPLLPGLLWPGVVVPVRVLSMDWTAFFFFFKYLYWIGILETI